MESIKLSIALIQTELIWENYSDSINRIEQRLGLIDFHPDLILLPEMFASGFTMNPESVAETMDGKAVNWMQEMAGKRNAAICGSLVIRENGQYFNRLLFVHQDGKIDHYDKRHLFSFAGENQSYEAGKKKLIVEFMGWKICPLICYDLRFPVFSRNVEDYDLLLYVSNWPQPRVAAWDALLKARAIENMCYVAGVNRVGHDGNGHRYTGHSNVYDCFGNALLDETENESNLKAVLDLEALSAARKKFTFLEDRDQFTVM